MLQSTGYTLISLRTSQASAERPRHPGRWVSHTILVLAALFAVATPFADVPNRWLFFIGGIGYSAFLAVLSVGIALLHEPLRSRILRAGLCVQLLCLLACGVFLLLLRAGHLCFPPFAPVTVVLVSVLAMLIAFASLGWYQYFTNDTKSRSA